ncbi:hypothetical protein PGT21_030293 [Puccinia graminis f. sp. tritici]|uniref:Uncharacterized protein n=1 Tax=Puccinia graminis f. sp. tritici TaxID=56615 RepID=A0A5B0S0N2_PUCGR|nr:hypothetical protein PGT21_030293 [Puccinia graminis f. sp. tritici]KAA1131302.1 hypothetical protein PGTUg99_030767 [Puccinia graminis f. sp. tritici]
MKESIRLASSCCSQPTDLQEAEECQEIRALIRTLRVRCVPFILGVGQFKCEEHVDQSQRADIGSGMGGDLLSLMPKKSVIKLLSSNLFLLRTP